VVLIADADSENAVVLQAMLAPEYDIKFAADRIAAVSLASPPDQPALILLSDLLPAADALGVLKDLKTGDFTKDIRVIILSEPTAGDTEAKGFELGAADCVTRPFKKSVLHAGIRQTVRHLMWNSMSVLCPTENRLPPWFSFVTCAKSKIGSIASDGLLIGNLPDLVSSVNVAPGFHPDIHPMAF